MGAGCEIMSKRIILNLILLLSVLFMPWWVSVVLALFLVFYLNNFYEIVIFGFVMDALYGTGQFYFIIGALVMFAAVYLFKSRVRYYD